MILSLFSFMQLVSNRVRATAGFSSSLIKLILRSGSQTSGVVSSAKLRVPSISLRAKNKSFKATYVDLLPTFIFYAKTAIQYALIIWLFFKISKELSLLLFSEAVFKRSLNKRKPSKNNFVKWKTKQSWKGNVWNYLFILPTFFTWGRN